MLCRRMKEMRWQYQYKRDHVHSRLGTSGGYQNKHPHDSMDGNGGGS